MIGDAFPFFLAGVGQDDLALFPGARTADGEAAAQCPDQSPDVFGRNRSGRPVGVFFPEPADGVFQRPHGESLVRGGLGQRFHGGGVSSASRARP